MLYLLFITIMPAFTVWTNAAVWSPRWDNAAEQAGRVGTVIIVDVVMSVSNACVIQIQGLDSTKSFVRVVMPLSISSGC